MKTYTTHEIKNVVLLGASGSGKTTLAEAMAFDGKVIDRRGSIENDNTHGTGCTLSSAIACGLAKGFTVFEACEYAKRYISGALAAQLDLGKGSGPLDHMWEYRGR